MAFGWRADDDPLLVPFGSSPLTKKKKCQRWIPLAKLSGSGHVLSRLPQALEIMENLENQEEKFHAWKNHGI